MSIQTLTTSVYSLSCNHCPAIFGGAGGARVWLRSKAHLILEARRAGWWADAPTPFSLYQSTKCPACLALEAIGELPAEHPF
jgi:hypothetical protein